MSDVKYDAELCERLSEWARTDTHTQDSTPQWCPMLEKRLAEFASRELKVNP